MTHKSQYLNASFLQQYGPIRIPKFAKQRRQYTDAKEIKKLYGNVLLIRQRNLKISTD